jgi:alkylation response protein AidB-like acyl-CoA dehydrogenase
VIQLFGSSRRWLPHAARQVGRSAAAKCVTNWIRYRSLYFPQSLRVRVRRYRSRTEKALYRTRRRSSRIGFANNTRRFPYVSKLGSVLPKKLATRLGTVRSWSREVTKARTTGHDRQLRDHTMTTTLDGATILAKARAIAPVIREEAAKNERCRRLTARTVEALRSTGVFRMSMPHSWGGPEVDISTQIEIVEEVSRADGSAGWCAMIGSDGGFYSAAMDDKVGRALYPDLDAVTAGWIRPAGRLNAIDGGYHLSGRWQFGSGCTHADVVIGGCLVFRDAKPVVSTDGIPELRIAVLPANHFQIHDTWHTLGLAGTGSNDYSIENAFVPADQTFRLRDRRRDGALYAWPGLFVVNLLGVPLGIARAALEVAEPLLADKILTPQMRPARDDPRIRTGLGRAEAMVGSARSYVFDVVGDFWATLEAGAEPSRRQRAALAGCYGHTLATCRGAVELLVDTVGSAAIFRSCPLEQHLRDLITIGQHFVCQPRLMEVTGALWIGGGDDHPLLVEQVL